jgi:putative heme iron utilization protein
VTAESDTSRLARSLVKETRAAALGTLGSGGEPFVSYVITASAANGSPLLLLSRLARHSRNLERDPRASLLLVREPDPDLETRSAIRLTLLGRVVADADPQSRTLFLAQHPDAGDYVGFADFSFHRFEVEAGHLVADFGRIVTLGREELVEGTACES